MTEEVTETLARLQSWLDEDGQNWGQREKDTATLIAAARIPAAPDVERLKGENAELRKERDALLQEPIDHAKMDSIDDGGDTPTLMTAYYWWKQAKEARAALTAIQIPATVEAARIPAAPDDVVEELMLVRNCLGDLRNGFAKNVDPARWVEQVLATLDKALTAIPIPATGEVERETAISAWLAGARAVHDEWAKADEGERFYLSRDHEPDFTEAAHDYVAALTDHTTKDDE